MNRFLVIAILLLHSAIVFAQDQSSPIKVPLVTNRGLGTPITPYTDRPPDITLIPHGAEARPRLGSERRERSAHCRGSGWRPA